MECVTPFVGVWIETSGTLRASWTETVTPFVGVWIETRNFATTEAAADVTPFVGVWIETLRHLRSTQKLCHTLRGCVD